MSISLDDPNKIKCGNCKFYTPFEMGSSGRCRYNPPQVISHRENWGDRKHEILPCFPEVPADCFCGKFESRKIGDKE